MIYGSVCSGIEAATVAWHGLGWKPAWFSEIDAFPAALLARHYPNVPNLGDFTRIKERPLATIKVDCLVGGTPCQAFSVAGSRRSLADERGNLTLEFVVLADYLDPDFIVWENVPGVLNTKDNAFGCFLGALAGEDSPLVAPGGRWSDAGCVLGPKRAIAWRSLDAQYFGLAQRRKRVFVVACPRNGANPTEILFEFDGVRRDSPPSREAGEEIATDAERGAIGWSEELNALGELMPTLSRGGQGGRHDGVSHWADGPHPCLSQALRSSGGIGFSNQEIFSQQGAGLVPSALCINARQDPALYPEATGALDVGQETYAVMFGGNRTSAPCDVAPACNAKGGSGRMDFETEPLIAHTLTRRYDSSEDGCGRGTPLVTAFAQNTRDEVREMPVVGALAAEPGMKQTSYIRQHMAVRRITPTEAERLQGFPDNYTLIPYRKKPAADGPRYKAIGNSMATNVMRWIGERIENYRRLHGETHPR